MRRNATKVAAAVLSLAVTMTSVNIPTSAAAATKKVKLNKTKATLTVGKSTTLKLKQGTKVLKATFTSNKPKIAKVGKKTGKVTAKKKGTATITATYKKKKYKCKITVKAKAKPTVKPTAAPTTEPTAAPTTEPTAAPTDAPSTEPTAAPADTVGAITSVEAKSATTIVATFESALPATAVLTLTKGTTDTGVKAVIDEARTTATFTSASKYAVGTYTVTATAGESKQSKDVEIKEQSVQDIVIKSKQALTDHSKKKIYAYYDVVDQYGESMRSSTSVTWTTGSGTVKADKTTGCLTITKTEEFRYGENVYLVGVDTKSGKSVQVTLPVGMERALDTIKFEGFINKDNKENILETLPKDFTSGKYFLLFTAYDQDGNEIDASKDFTDTQKGAKVTFVADNPTLIKSEFKGGDVYTIKGKKYCSVSVEPGMYIDKGGDVNITAISNTTGNKTTKNFVIGAGAVLKSLSLNVPTDVIADGDQDVNIPFVAKDTEGKDVTNYETIVRSTNSLRLTATQGELVVYETESGSAAIKWNDSAEFGNGKYTDGKTGFARSSAHDGIDRPVSLMTTVIGGESNSVIMNVADKRRPVAISYVKLNDDDNNTITESNNASINFFADKVKFVDQYGKVHETWENGEWANAFFEQAASSDGFHGKQYGIKVDYSSVDDKEISIAAIKNSSTVKVPDDGKYIVLQNKNNCGELKIETKALDNNSAVTNNIKYSIVQLEDPENNGWDAVDAENSIDYTIVPVGKLSDLRIKDIAKVRIETDYSNYENGYGNTSPAAIVELEGKTAIVADETKRDVVVAGNYEGKTVTIPNAFYDVSGNDTFEVVKKSDGTNSTINALTGSAILYRELYDFNTARLVRKDARKDVSAKVYSKKNCEGDVLGTAKTSVLVSDALRYPVSITFYQRNAVANKIDFAPEDTKFEFSSFKRMQQTWDDTWPIAGIIVKDQYGNTINIADPSKEKGNNEVSVEFSVSNIVENSGEYAHLPKSFIVNRNNSDLASLDKVEIKDTFDLTATVAGTGVSTKVSVTVNADKLAKISSSPKANSSKDDEDLRKTLGYNR